MRLTIGQQAPAFNLTDINGKEFRSESLKGKRYLLTFYRFAACPFCNIRLHNISFEYDKFNDDFEVIAVFDSSVENLQRFVKRHHASFPVLADENNSIHKLYRVEHSALGVLKGIVLRFFSLSKAMLNGYIPWRIKGDITGMPADFLIDENGIIQNAYYANDEGDHIPIHLIKQFSQRRDEMAMNFQEI